MQLISQMQQIFRINKLPLWLKTYEILATGPRCGLIEVVNDAKSIDEIHRINLNLEDDPSSTTPVGRTSLLEYF